MKIRAYAAPILATSAVAALATALFPGAPRLFAGQVAIVTGGSRGLGLAIAHRLGRAGLKVVLAARKAVELDQARTALVSPGADFGAPSVADPADILLVVADLTDPAQAQNVVQQTLQRFGRLDVLVNNAGIIEVGPIENQTLDAFERAMRTNFFAALYMIDAALPYLLARPDRIPRNIVNIASVGGKMPVPHMLPYTAAKFALTGFSEGLHAELRSKGIRVTTVCPGLLRTGGESHAVFVGQQKKEQRWFNASARTPVIAASATNAADAIFRAVRAGRAEITITPQAWVAARLFGMAPEATQYVSALANQLILPNPAKPAAPAAELSAG